MTEIPTRTPLHEQMSVFLGRWSSHGTSYGGTDQSGPDPKANGESWQGTHEGSSHTGSYFLLLDERADIAGRRFDTLSVMGVGEDGEAFARCFENHGFYRNYRVSCSGDEWWLDGQTERARIVFSEGNRKQTITWEWKREERWLPLCDRVAVRVH